MHRATGRAAKLAVAVGGCRIGRLWERQRQNWETLGTAAAELGDSGNGGGRPGSFRASLGGGECEVTV